MKLKYIFYFLICLFVPHYPLYILIRQYKSLIDFVENYASRYREENDYNDVKIKVFMNYVEECLFEGTAEKYTNWRDNCMEHIMYLSVYRFFAVDGTIEIYLEYDKKQLLKYRIAKLKEEME